MSPFLYFWQLCGIIIIISHFLILYRFIHWVIMFIYLSKFFFIIGPMSDTNKLTSRRHRVSVKTDVTASVVRVAGSFQLSFRGLERVEERANTWLYQKWRSVDENDWGASSYRKVSKSSSDDQILGISRYYIL